MRNLRLSHICECGNCRYALLCLNCVVLGMEPRALSQGSLVKLGGVRLYRHVCALQCLPAQRTWPEDPTPLAHTMSSDPAWYYFTVYRNLPISFISCARKSYPQRSMPRLHSRSRLGFRAGSASFLLTRRAPVSPAFVLLAKPNPVIPDLWT